jgi:hypothetical protein
MCANASISCDIILNEINIMGMRLLNSLNNKLLVGFRRVDGYSRCNKKY